MHFSLHYEISEVSYEIYDFFLVGKPTISNYHSTISLVFLAQSRGFSPRVFPALKEKGNTCTVL